MDTPSPSSTGKPEKPVLLFDGTCGFCKLWVERWKSIARGKTGFAPSREAGEDYPQVDPAQFEKSVVLVEPDGSYTSAAEAVIRALKDASWTFACFFRLYTHIALFRNVSEWAYTRVARNRGFFSFLTRILYGRHADIPRYRFAGWLFPRAFGIVALAAVVSLWAQAPGLFGTSGILPFDATFEALDGHFSKQGESAFWRAPSLFWWFDANAGLHAVFALAVAACVFLIAGIAPPLAFLLLWISYLSILHAGQVFLSFQWDILLAQTAFLGFLASHWTRLDRLKARADPPGLPWFALRFSFVALLFESGMVKLQSYGIGDVNTWRDFTALESHYWTQPLPHTLSWHVHHLPEAFHALSLGFMFLVELVLSLLLLAPRRVRAVAVFGQVLLQLAIIATGNYGFFNLLTIVLCLPFIDDSLVPGRWLQRLANAGKDRVGADRSPARLRHAGRSARGMLAGILVLMMALEMIVSMEDTREGRPIARAVRNAPGTGFAFDWLSGRFRVVSGYGLFRVMTTTRPEIEIAGSINGRDWRVYDFKYKPDSVESAPPFIVPHMPRLDWQMWFAALRLEGAGSLPPWMIQFLQALAEGRDPVLELLAADPFPDEPPPRFRIRLYHFRFTSPEERKESGHVWVRKREGEMILRVQGR